MNPEFQDRLEASVDRVLRSVPDRRAPSGLEARVMAELARRAALPWWRRSYSHWPGAVRALFFVGSAAAVGAAAAALLLVLHTPSVAAVTGGSYGPLAWLRSCADMLASAGQMFRTLVASVRPLYLYGALGIVGVLYATLGAVSAATYRTLNATRN